jgi:MoxR-like ATPase
MSVQPASPAQTRSIAERVLAEVGKVIVGQDEVLELMLTAHFAGGHLLFEGVPGLAKTLMVKAFAVAMGGEFSRIQFTPDLLPSDILGTSIFDLGKSEFRFRQGPIFCSFLLADEVNRTPPKTQAALLEAMEERFVSVDGQTMTLPETFTVFATQNPIEYEGTYPLPEAQLDRFLLKVVIDYPTEQEERTILQRYDQGFNPHQLQAAGVSKVVDASDREVIRREIDAIRVEPGVLDYILLIIRQTRLNRTIALGGSPRAGIALLLGSKALAAIRGKTYITPDEVQTLAVPVLRHRLLLTPESELEGGDVTAVIQSVMSGVPVPR